MNESEEIKHLQGKISQLQKVIKNCKHNWAKAKYDPETVKEGYGNVMVAHGSDVWSDFEGYRDVDKPRWSRKCNVCGHVEYTYTQEVIKVEKQPKFNS